MLLQVQTALTDWRRQAMESIPAEKRNTGDWPSYFVTDLSLAGEGGTALINSDSSEEDAWEAGFKLGSEGQVELEPFAKWTAAKQERVASSEKAPAPKKSSTVRPAGRTSSPAGMTGLQEAQAARSERMKLGTPTTTTGGSMGRFTDLLSGVELSDEVREALLAEEARVARFESEAAAQRERERQSEVTAYCGTSDGSSEGLLDKIGLGDPGVKKYVRNALLSDDGGPAIELSEHLSDGQKTAGVPRTATELLKGFIDILPKREDGKVSLADQARRLPDDPKPAADSEPKPEDPKANADALLAEFQSQGFDGLVLQKEG